ncbi:MAG: hypothetical protein IPM46_09630 [Flavobacteriales bacterium]|nr:hypothetical protein [Flavobacteriales bacterium]
MGEGWSDWFGLINTITEPGLSGRRRPRHGIPISGEAITGVGIRPARYFHLLRREQLHLRRHQ